MTRCSWAKPRTSATPGPTRKRRRPQPAEARIAGFPDPRLQFYDYHHDVENVTFRNYQDNATRKTGALSYLLFTSFGISTNNASSA